MPDEDGRTPDDHEGLAEIEAAEAENARKAKEYDRRQRERLADPRTRRGIEAVIRANVEDHVTDVVGRLSEANAAQLHQLAKRLEALGLMDLSDDSDEEVDVGFTNNLQSGEIVVAICPDGEHLYSEQGSQLIVQREAKGRTQYRRLDDDGEPIQDWQDAPSPSSRSQFN